jgi:hypothetical protein
MCGGSIDVYRGGGGASPPLDLKKIKIGKSKDLCQILILNITIIFKFGPIYVSVLRSTTLGASVKYFIFF